MFLKRLVDEQAEAECVGSNDVGVVEEWNSVEIPSFRVSSQWINGCVENRSGFREEDDSNTGEVRENLCWCSVYCEAQGET